MALTLNNLIGFETGGLEEALATAGAPALNEATVRTGDYSVKLTSDGDQYDIPIISGGSDGGDWYILGFAIYFDQLNTNQLLFAYDSVGWCWYMVIDGSGNVTIRDSVGDIIDAKASGVFNISGWYYCEVAWQHNAAGTLTLHVNTVEEVSGTGDLDAGGAIDGTAYYRLNSSADYTSVYFDDIYCYSGAAGVGDFLGDCEVFGKQANTNSATPDTGDDLDYGDPNALWQEVGTTPGDADEIGYAAYPRTGAVYTDDVESGKHYRHGPHGDANIDGTIKGAKFLHQLRGVGAGTYYKRYGNDGDGLTDAAVVLTTAYVSYMTVSELATVVPLSTEHFALGFKNIDEKKDLLCKGMWAFILHVPPAVAVNIADLQQQIAPSPPPVEVVAY